MISCVKSVAHANTCPAVLGSRNTSSLSEHLQPTTSTLDSPYTLEPTAVRLGPSIVCVADRRTTGLRLIHNPIQPPPISIPIDSPPNESARTTPRHSSAQAAYLLHATPKSIETSISPECVPSSPHYCLRRSQRSPRRISLPTSNPPSNNYPRPYTTRPRHRPQKAVSNCSSDKTMAARPTTSAAATSAHQVSAAPEQQSAPPTK
jgi:hypothetical protein